MNKTDEEKIYDDAISCFGETSQKIMVVEEMSELIKEMCKDLRNRGNVEHIADEVADVEVTLAQIKKIYNIHKLVEEHKDFKLRRLSERILENKMIKKEHDDDK